MSHTITHPEMVRRLAKTGTNFIAELTPASAHLLHMAVGVSTEATELFEAVNSHVTFNNPLDVVNVIEELGDLLFYMQGVRHTAGAGIPDFVGTPEVAPHHLQYHASEIVIASGNLLDNAKKHAIHLKPLHCIDVQSSLVALEYHIARMCDLVKTDRQACITANMAKLEKRYPGFRYSDAAAQARADKEGGQ